MRPLLNFVIDQPDDAMARYLAVSDMTDCLAREPDISAGVASKGDLCWSFQTYLNLRALTTLPVILSNEPREDAVNFVHSDQLAGMGGPASAFIVCLRADFPARRWAHFHIVQNMRQAGRSSRYLPLWMQPGILKRDPGRQRVERVGYLGQTFNGNLAEDDRTWRKAFDQIGLDFVTPPKQAWGDFREIDIVVGVRSFDQRSYPSKPPSKLVNAWRAEVPFIGGNDCAFSQVGMAGRDFLRASTLNDVVSAAASLRDDPVRYARIVENGVKLVERFSVEAVAARWVHVIDAAILPRHAQWLKRRAYETGRFHVQRSLGRIEKSSRAVIRRALDVSFS